MLGFVFDIHQTFEAHDLVVIAFLVVLEGVLSIDNALVLGILAKRLPKHQQKKALTYGLIGAFVFRLLAIALATILIRLTIVKLIGGAYLLWMAIKHFVFERGDEHDSIEAKAAAAGVIEEESVTAEQREHAAETLAHQAPASQLAEGSRKARAAFWPTVLVIELTDIAFAVDSILAAIGVVGAPPPGTPSDALHPKYWVVLTGGFLGVILMRYAAILFIKLLEKFPRFEEAAYILVAIIGIKLLVDWAAYQFNFTVDFHHTTSPAFWIFWISMVLAFCVGFLPQRTKTAN